MTSTHKKRAKNNEMMTAKRDLFMSCQYYDVLTA